MNFAKLIIPWKGDSFSDIMRKLVVIASVPLFVYSIVQLNDYRNENKSIESYSSEIQQYEPDFSSEAEIEKENADEDTEEQTDSVVEESEPIVERKIQKWAKKLVKRNNETVGWIKIPGFVNSDGDEYINYPVLQHDDNEYYLTHDVDKNYYESGSIFADYVTPIDKNGQPQNIILYGHHMRNLGTSFTHLAEYKSGVDLLKECPIIEFNTIYDNNEEYIIFSCYVAAIEESQDNGKLFDYWRYRDFDDEDYTFKHWLKMTKKSSWYSCDIECNEDDDYLTLSTCSNEVPNMRWVIVAKKLTDNDDKDAIISSYKEKKDKNIYFPQVWKDVWGNHKKYLGWNY